MSKQNIEFKDSGISYIDKIPIHWNIAKVKNIVKIPVQTGAGEEAQDKHEKSIRYIRISDFDLNGKIKPEVAAYIHYEKGKNFLIEKGDILCATAGATVGKTLFFEGLDEPSCYAGYLAKIRVNPNKMLNTFLLYQMRCQIMDGFRNFFVKKSTIENISAKTYSNMPIIVPPLNEQKKIAEFLDKKCEIIDKRLSNLERKIKSLKEYKKSLISECVTTGLNPKNMEFKDSGIPWCPQIPSDWQVINPKILFKQRNQKAKSGEIQYTASQEFGIISQEEYTRKTGYNMVKVLKGFDILKHVEVGDFVISMRSFQGGLEYSNVSGSISSAYVMLIPNSKFVNNRYFRWLFKSSKYIDALQSTTNLIRDGQAMRYSNFALIKLIVPSLNEQKEIAEFLDKKCEKIDRLNENYTKQITALKEYKKSLIYECVTGKKEI